MRVLVRTFPAVLLLAAVACEERAEPEVSAGPGAAVSALPTGLACAPMLDNMELENRSSPYDSLRVSVGGEDLLVCYGRPSARGRVMIGGEAVPYGELWRTGANEPTTLHIPFAAELAGIAVEPGSYTLYTIPNPTEWTVILNRSITQWGEEGSYTPEVEAQEVGRGTVPAGRTSAPVETFTITSEPGDAGETNLVLEWEGSRVEIPIRRSGA